MIDETCSSQGKQQTLFTRLPVLPPPSLLSHEDGSVKFWDISEGEDKPSVNQ